MTRNVTLGFAVCAALLLSACAIPSPPRPVVAPAPSAPAGAPATAAAAATSAPAAVGTRSTDATSAAGAAWESRYRGKVVRGFTPEAGYKAVALTFDDGPNHETAYVIQTLELYGGKATFFFTGKLLARPGASKQAVLVESHGFEVGNHTQHHTIADRSSLIGRTLAQDVAEITGPDRLLQTVVGHPTLWLRPMGGEIDANGIAAAKKTGHLVIDWTLDSMDSHGWNHTPDQILHNVTTGVVAGDVILMHVTHPETMAALPRICAQLTAQGFKLVTLSDLAAHSRPFFGERKR